MSNKTTTVYWTPLTSVDSQEPDWSILYEEPQSLFERKLEEKVDIADKQTNFFYCPAFSNFAKNTFVLKNPIKVDVPIIQNNSFAKVESLVPVYQTRDSCLKDHTTIKYNMQWVFFAEEDDIHITVTEPYMDQAPHLLQGHIVPGRFSASSWFRPINLDYNFYPGVKQYTVEEGEPLAYINFDSDKQVKLVKFNLTEKLRNLALTCSMGASWEKWVPLAKRYRRFKESRLKSIILKEIKENLYD